MIKSLILDTLKYLKEHKLILFITLAACILTLLPTIFDGHYGCVNKKCGYIIGTNYRDGVWFLAIANVAFQTYPFRMPNFSGETLQGYHFLPNLLAHLLTFIGIPVTFSFYQLFPILFMIGLIILAIKYGRKIKDDPKFVAFFLFFTFFGMPFTLFTSLYHHGYINNGMIINTFQSTRLMESIHAGFAYLIMIGIILFIQKKQITFKERLIIAGLIIIVFGTKFYTAFIIIFMLFIYELIHLIQTKKIIPFIQNNAMYAISSLIGIMIFYNPFTTVRNGGIFIFSPFATVHHLIESPDLFNLHQMVLARYFLYAHGWSPRLVAIELFSTFLFILFYFGTRFVGFFYIAKQIITRKITSFEIVLTASIIFSLIMSIMFIQKGDWFNPMQFAVYGSFIMNIFAAKCLYEMFNIKHKILALFAGVIIFITIPSNLLNLTYLTNPNRYIIPKEEMQALAVLKKMPDGAVYAPIYDPDMAYVAAFSGKPSYLNYVSDIQNTGITTQSRENQVATLDNLNVDSLDVTYIYIPNSYPDHEKLLAKCLASTQYKKVYTNSHVSIFKRI